MLNTNCKNTIFVTFQNGKIATGEKKVSPPPFLSGFSARDSSFLYSKTEQKKKILFSVFQNQGQCLWNEDKQTTFLGPNFTENLRDLKENIFINKTKCVM